MIKAKSNIDTVVVDGFPGLRLSNGRMEALVLPALGGKVWSLRDMESGRNWIWNNPQVPLRAVPPGAGYDENWAGGWEELFPCDAAGKFLGRDLPDHGEWWSRAWEWAVADSESGPEIRMRLNCRSIQASCEKIVTLAADRPELTISYRIENLENEPIHFLFKQHLAVAVVPTDRLELPGGQMTAVDRAFSTRLGGEGPYAWPIGVGGDGLPADLSALPSAEQGHREFIYVSELPEGWCGVRAAAGGRLRLRFPTDIFPHTWLFMTFGGWRGHYAVVLEPCTNKPKDLSAAFKAGQCASLPRGGVLECSVTASFE